MRGVRVACLVGILGVSSIAGADVMGFKRGGTMEVEIVSLGKETIAIGGPSGVAKFPRKDVLFCFFGSDEDFGKWKDEFRQQPLSPKAQPKTKIEQETVIMPDYSVYDEEIYEIPLKTQVLLRVLVSGEITEAGLRALLNKLYASTKARTGFKYHQSPTNIYIYAFTSKEKGQSGSIAHLGMSNGQAKPVITVSERQMAQLGKKPKQRFGLTEAERKRIYKEIFKAEEMGLKAAEKKHGSPAPLEAIKRYSDQYRNQLAKKHELARNQLGEINMEGIEKDWPFF